MPSLKFHVVHFPLAADLYLQPLRQCIHHRRAHAVQPAADLVGRSGRVLELSTRPQFRKHHLHRRYSLFRMDADRNSPPIIHDRAAPIGIDLDQNAVAEPGPGFVDRIIDDFINQVVQPARRGVADVHARPLAHVLHPLQHLDHALVVIAFFECFFFLRGLLICHENTPCLGVPAGSSSARLPVQIHPLLMPKNRVKKTVRTASNPSRILSQKSLPITMRIGSKTRSSEAHFCPIFPAIFALFSIALF